MAAQITEDYIWLVGLRERERERQPRELSHRYSHYLILFHLLALIVSLASIGII